MFEPPEDRPFATCVVEVRSYELDSFGHANHAVYLNWLEYARFEALRAAGFPYEDIIARGWGIYAVRIEVDYVREVKLGQRLLIHTWADGYRRTSMVLTQRIGLESDVSVEVARARVTAVWIGPDGRPIRVPAVIRRRLGGDPT